jgi:hypothetical protein
VLEKETERLIDIILLRSIGNSSSITVKDILAADIPYPVKAFFRADVEMILMKEVSTGRKNSRFNYSHPEVQNLQQQMNSILVLHYPFERDEFISQISDVVHVLMNYLVRPQWTLTNAIFENEPSVSTRTLIPMLKHFGPYEYFRDVFQRYTHDKNITHITRDEFSTLLWKIDTECIRRKTGDELARILSPLYEFVFFPNQSSDQAIPVKALIRYFEDKGVTSAVLRLEGELAQSTLTLTRTALAEILEAVRRTAGGFETEQPELTVASVINETDTKLSGRENSIPTASDLVRMELLFDEHDRQRYIKRIFRQDEQAFSSALHSIGTMKSWKEASRFIDEIYIKNEIDPYSFDAERFTQLIFQQYQHTS